MKSITPSQPFTFNTNSEFYSNADVKKRYAICLSKLKTHANEEFKNKFLDLIQAYKLNKKENTIEKMPEIYERFKNLKSENMQLNEEWLVSCFLYMISDCILTHDQQKRIEYVINMQEAKMEFINCHNLMDLQAEASPIIYVGKNDDNYLAMKKHFPQLILETVDDSSSNPDLNEIETKDEIQPLSVRKTKAAKSRRKQSKLENNKEKALMLANKGTALGQEGNFKDALIAYQEAHALVPSSWDYYVFMISMHYKLKSFQEAIRLSHIVIQGLEKEEDTDEHKKCLFFVNSHCGNSYLSLSEAQQDEAIINLGIGHLNAAKSNPLPAIERAKPLLEDGLLLGEYYRFKARKSKEDGRQCALQAQGLLLKRIQSPFSDRWHPALVETTAYLSNYTEVYVALREAGDSYLCQQNYAFTIECYKSYLNLIIEDNNLSMKQKMLISSEVNYQLAVCLELSGNRELAFEGFCFAALQINTDITFNLKSLVYLSLSRLLDAKCLVRSSQFLVNNTENIRSEIASITEECKTKSDDLVKRLEALLTIKTLPFVRSNILAMLGYIYRKNKNMDLAIASYEAAQLEFPLNELDRGYLAKLRDLKLVSQQRNNGLSFFAGSETGIQSVPAVGASGACPSLQL